MNAKELKVEMIRHNDTGESLAKKLNISSVSFSKKMNSNGTEFTQSEILSIRDEYHLSPERLEEIFFAKEMS